MAIFRSFESPLVALLFAGRSSPTLYGRIERQERASLSCLSNVLINIVLELLLFFGKLISNICALCLLGLKLDDSGFELEDLVLYFTAL